MLPLKQRTVFMVGKGMSICRKGILGSCKIHYSFSHHSVKEKWFSCKFHGIVIFLDFFTNGFIICLFHIWFKKSLNGVKQELSVLKSEFNSSKEVRELMWMSHGVMHFCFLLNFVLISAFFDILASLSISRVFSSVISGRWKYPQIFPEQLSNLIIWINVWGAFLSNYKYFSCESSCLLLLLEVCKNHYKNQKSSL